MLGVRLLVRGSARCEPHAALPRHAPFYYIGEVGYRSPGDTYAAPDSPRDVALRRSLAPRGAEMRERPPPAVEQGASPMLRPAAAAWLGLLSLVFAALLAPSLTTYRMAALLAP